LPSPEAQELALLLVRKAEGDESILVKLLDGDVPDDALGPSMSTSVRRPGSGIQ